MSSKNIALSVRGLSKVYTIAHNAPRHTTAGEALMHRFRNPFPRVDKETFWALKDVSFDIERGDVVGIIGRNGAGKSTLLKILSRITEPTQGKAVLRGRVGSLLEVGTGFHAELTGRENIYLNGVILGMSRREIDRQFDAIVDFAGVEQFLDTPVKRYSSGMYVRLAFAVAAHLRSEILIVDEVLAVGDMEFQKKCLGKMKDVAESGRTVLFVSHQMQAVSTLCDSAILLDEGKLNYIGDVGAAVDRYMNQKRSSEDGHRSLRRGGTGEVRFNWLKPEKEVYLSTEPITIEAEMIAYSNAQPSYFVSLEFVNSFGLHILHLDSRLLNVEFKYQPRRTIRYMIAEPRLAQGDYAVNAFICHAGGILDRYERAAELTIAPILPYPASRNDCVGNAVVYPKFSIQELNVPISTTPISGRTEEMVG